MNKKYFMGIVIFLVLTIFTFYVLFNIFAPESYVPSRNITQELWEVNETMSAQEIIANREMTNQEKFDSMYKDVNFEPKITELIGCDYNRPACKFGYKCLSNTCYKIFVPIVDNGGY